MYQVVIANRLRDGLVVYLHEAEHWVESIDAATVAGSEADGERLLARALEPAIVADVVDPYLIEISDADGQRKPVVLREAIRAAGPTVQTAFN